MKYTPQIENALKTLALCARKARKLKYNPDFIILEPEIKKLEENIKIRCEKRWDKMLQETRNLLHIKKIDQNWLKDSGLEYGAIIKYLEGEIKTEQECKDWIILKSLQYSKRQIKWNKRYIAFI